MLAMKPKVSGSKIYTLSLFCALLSFLPIEEVEARKCFDVTGCCPPEPCSQSVTCTIFGCHSCNGTEPAGKCQDKDCCPVNYAGPCRKAVRIKHKKRIAKRRKAHIVKRPPCCIEPVKRIKKCDKLLDELIECKVIFPGDIEENLCREFQQKLLTCEPTTCFAPYSQDPTFRTTWEILGKNANRCVISSTYEDIGFRDRKDKPLPITLTCEYDKIGIIALIKRFNDMDRKYYHFTTCERGVGIHNCSITSNGIPIKKVKLNNNYFR